MGLAAGIEVTRACNFRCEHCFVDAGRRGKDELSGEELRALIDELACAGADTVAWSGGEPLLRRDLDELTRHAKSRGMEVGLATNGFFGTRERLTRLANAGLDLIQVSVDGPDPQRAERYRKGPRGAFERALTALRESAKLGITPVVCSLFSPETASEIEEMIAFSRSLGARMLRYTMWAPVGRAEGGRYDERAWKRPAVRRFLEVAAAWRGARELDVIIDCPTGLLPGQPGFQCYAGSAAIYVCSTGEVYPCTALMTPEYLVGNVRERPVGEILRDRRMSRIHSQLRRKPAGRCARCSRLEVCNGGCPGRTLAASGDVRAEAPACLWRLHARRAPARARG